MRSRTLHRAVAVGLLTGSLVAPSGLAPAADRLYYFVDEHGVAHFSNVPADSRYKPLMPSDWMSPLPSAAPQAPLPSTAADAPTSRPAARTGQIDVAPLPGPVDLEDSELDAEDDR